MSSSGFGRGRGWLNLNKNPSRPGDPHIVPSEAPCSKKFTKIIANIDEINENDDGILLNQKLRFITELLQDECKSSIELEECFDVIFQRCIESSNFASKVVSMVSSYSFGGTEIHNLKVRNVFIAFLQKYFENCKPLQSRNPAGFRNSVLILGEFFHKARLGDGHHIKFLSTPFLTYLEMLLDTAQPADLELFTVLLYLNGSKIKAENPQKIEELILKVRNVLVTNMKLTQTCKLWMLLALDTANQRFGLLSAELHSFYQERLGDEAIATFQGTPSILSIQTTHSNKRLDDYQSNVNVLQVTPPESTSPVGEISPQPATNSVHNNFSNAHVSQKFDDLGLSADSWDLPRGNLNGKGFEKAGRPILGAGARLHRNKSAADHSKPNWKGHSKENSTGWVNRPKNAGGSKWAANKKPPGGEPRTNKGWEHDDRFENDYN